MRCNNFSSPTHASRGLPDPNRNRLQQAKAIVQVIGLSGIILTLDFTDFISHTLSSCFHKKERNQLTHTIAADSPVVFPLIHRAKQRNMFVRDDLYLLFICVAYCILKYGFFIQYSESTESQYTKDLPGFREYSMQF